jgi:membrane protein YqaA with SNARE-associated domain
MEGYLGLFLSAFLAATLLPFSSEAVLAALSAFDRHDPVLLWAAASVGNTLGSLVNWALGRCFLRFRDRRWFPVGPERLDRARERFRRYGAWTLLFAWLPVVGDPLTLAAGALGVKVWPFLALVGAGKAARYAVVALAAAGLV